MELTDKRELNESSLDSLAIEFPEKKSLGEHVYKRLKQAIIDGEMAAGSRILETRIANSLGISRTPVREAIHKLDRAGFLEQLPSGGFAVAGLTREGIEEIFGIRSILESYAARLATIKHKEDELRPLEDKLREFRTCVKKGQLDALSRINTEFHDMLYTLSRSPRLIKMVGDLAEQVIRFRKILLDDKNMVKLIDHDHNMMLEAMKDRDLDRVEKLVKEHILRGQKMVLKKFHFDIV
ncbi:GntR family transcriptional regulator [Thermodesulfobacteriota bacterium]